MVFSLPWMLELFEPHIFSSGQSSSAAVENGLLIKTEPFALEKPLHFYLSIRIDFGVNVPNK
jgi:hypothetical protein